MPRYKVKKKKNEWFNIRCAEAKKEKDRAWKKMMKQRRQDTREEYKRARNK